MITQAKSVVLVGCGNMGHALLRGWVRTRTLRPRDVHVVEPLDALSLRAADEGVHTHATPAALPADLSPDVVVLAVKPQMIASVAADYRAFALPGSDTVFVSVAAGVTLASLEAALTHTAPIVRVMPNTPAAVGEGMMVMCVNASVTGRQRGMVDALLATSGVVTTIEDETLMDAVTAISGSGPAYVFHMIEVLRDAGVGLGLPDAIAGQLALQTVFGAGAYARQSQEDPARLREQVTSPKGTTAAALDVLMRPGGLADLMTRAATAARDRSVELGQ